MIEYEIIKSFGKRSEDELIKRVNQRIKFGYIPIGGVFALVDMGMTTFYQAMTKEVLCKEK